MIVGKGMMAHAFSYYEASQEVLIFASGVSNSQERREEAFQREEDLLRTYLDIARYRDMIFVYFSTCSILDLLLDKSKYIMHKIKMENIIKRQAKKYLIFRLPQVVGDTDNKTLVRYFYDMIQSGQQFEVWANGYKNLIDCDDAFRICSYIVDKKLFSNCTINVASTIKTAIPEIVKIVEKTIDKKGNYVIVDKGSNFDIDLLDILQIIKEVEVEFDEQYPERIIKKYYGKFRKT